MSKREPDIFILWYRCHDTGHLWTPTPVLDVSYAHIEERRIRKKHKNVEFDLKAYREMKR